MKRRLLWVGDAGVPSGFARATHETLNVLRETWDVMVLGINYRGDPHDYPYPIYACAPGGDGLGVGRLIWMMDLWKPDVVVFQNDPWNIHHYTNKMDQFAAEYGHVTRVGAIAVDGKLCQGEALNGLNFCIFWTKFAEAEAKAGGYRNLSAVVPLGVDTDLFTPGDRREARVRLGMEPTLQDGYIVGNVNRNQPRKRLDLTIQYFAEWVREYDVRDAFLFLHVAPTGDRGFDCKRIAKYYGLQGRLALVQPPTFYGRPDGEMADTYRSFDAQMTTTLGEGFGLTTFEGMACAVPQIVPDWSALGELTRGAARQVPCTSMSVASEINTVGGVMDREQAVRALQELYVDAALRVELGEAGFARANEARFRWRNVGVAFNEALESVCAPVTV